MNDHECAHRRDLVLCAARWVAATDDSGWVWDPRTERVYLSPRLQNLLGWPAPVATLDELADTGLPFRVVSQKGAGLVWSDLVGVLRSRSERLRARHCCPICDGLPIEIGLLEGLAGGAALAECDLVGVSSVGGGSSSGDAAETGGVSVRSILREASRPMAASPDPFRERIAQLSELYAEVPEDYRLMASRKRSRPATVGDVLTALLVICVGLLVPMAAAVALVEGEATFLLFSLFLAVVLGVVVWLIG